jgi:hypothetical protein
MSKDAEIEELERLGKPDGFCWQCGRPANRHHPVGRLVITVDAPDGEETHEFCDWTCFGYWVADCAGGKLVIHQN